MHMTIVRRSLLGLLLGFAALLAGACDSQPPTGPVAIKYGRDTCDQCGMIISDPRFASQVRGGPGHKAFKFDDVGEALHYLARQPWKEDANVEIWVMDLDTGKTWLDARKAQFVPDKPSPMAFGFGATAVSRPGALSFDEMKAKVMQRGAGNMCIPDKV